MPVSPADFELYSRATGIPLPRTPEEQRQMAPRVYNFTRNYLRQPQQPNFFQETAENLGKLALLGLAGGAVYGLARQGGQKTPETPSKGQIGTVNSATIDLNPDYSPPTVKAGPDFNIQENIAPVSINPVYSSPTVEAGPEFSVQNTRPTENLSSGYSPLSVDAGPEFSVQENTVSEPSQSQITTVSNTTMIEDPWDDSNVSVMPREPEKSALGRGVSGQIERIRRQGGGRDLRTAAPGLAAGIGLRGMAPGLSGGGLGVGEGGALGQGAVKGFWGGIRNLPIVSQAAEGLENVGNIGVFGNTLGDAASTVFQGIPGLQEGANIGAVKLAELGGLGAGVVLDSAVKDTLAAGANVRRAVDPSGKLVPTLGQTVDYHNRVLVPGGKRLAGSVFNAISTSQPILPTSSAQASGNLIEGREPQVTRHPDLPPGETDQAPSRFPGDNLPIPSQLRDENVYVDRAVADAYRRLPIQMFDQGTGQGQSTSVKQIRMVDGQPAVIWQKGDGTEYIFNQPDGKALITPGGSSTLIQGSTGTKGVGTKVKDPMMDQILAATANEMEASDDLDALLTNKQVGLDEDFTAGKLASQLRKGQAFAQEYIRQGAELFGG